MSENYTGIVLQSITASVRVYLPLLIYLYIYVFTCILYIFYICLYIYITPYERRIPSLLASVSFDL